MFQVEKGSNPFHDLTLRTCGEINFPPAVNVNSHLQHSGKILATRKVPTRVLFLNTLPLILKPFPLTYDVSQQGHVLDVWKGRLDG